MGTRVVAAVALLMLAAPANAQQRLFALATTRDFTLTGLWEAAVEAGHVVEPRLVVVVAGPPDGGPVVVGGGQLVAWLRRDQASVATSLVAVDRATGAVRVIPDVGGTLVSDATRARVFARGPGGIQVLTAAGAAILPNTGGLTPVALSVDGLVLYATSVGDPGPPAQTQLHGLDPVSGARLGTAPMGTDVVQVLPEPDGASAWVVAMPQIPGSPGTTALRRVALPSGIEQVSVPLEPSLPGSVVSHRLVGLDANRRRLVMVTSRWVAPPGHSSPGSVRVFDADTATELPALQHRGSHAGFLDTGQQRILSFSQSTWSRPTLSCGPAVLHTQAVDTAGVVSESEVGTAECLRVTFAAPPPPPTRLAATISANRTVTLSWTRAPEQTTRFTVEAGSGPGLSDLAVLPVHAGTSLTVPNVPPGTYYVRVRAWNYVGGSAPSNEVLVTAQ